MTKTELCWFLGIPLDWRIRPDILDVFKDTRLPVSDREMSDAFIKFLAIRGRVSGINGVVRQR